MPCESLLPEDLIIIVYNAWFNEAVNFLHKRQLSGAKLYVLQMFRKEIVYFHKATKDWLASPKKLFLKT